MSKLLFMIATVAAVCCTGWLMTVWFNVRLRRRIVALTGQLGRDSLTGLLNRAGLAAAFAELGDRQRHLMIFLIDLDQFKPVNDRYGHAAGDELIVAVAKRIADVAESIGGHAARLSGDEFAVIAEWNRRLDIGRIADLFTRAIARPVVLAGHVSEAFQPSASVGAAWANSRDPLFEVAVGWADIAMYHAKRGGGDRHAVFAPGMEMPVRPSRRGIRIRDIHHRRPAGPAAIPSVAPQGQLVISAVRTRAGNGLAEFIVLLDCRNHAQHDMFATMRVVVAGDGSAEFSEGVFGMPWRHALASLFERSGVIPRSHVEVVMLAQEPHGKDQVGVFIDGHPAELASAIHVRPGIFSLDPDVGADQAPRTSPMPSRGHAPGRLPPPDGSPRSSGHSPPNIAST